MLTVDEAAQILNISRNSVRRFIRDGALYAVRPDGRRRYMIPREAVAEFSTPRPVRRKADPLDDLPALLTVAEVSEVLRYTSATVRRMVREGQLTAARNEGRHTHLRIHKAGVLRHLGVSSDESAA